MSPLRPSVPLVRVLSFRGRRLQSIQSQTKNGYSMYDMSERWRREYPTGSKNSRAGQKTRTEKKTEREAQKGAETSLKWMQHVS
ncbi:uncharacterized protein MONOS_14951 [Monocercomonoides exilis]|uniref:uncharacterized protein n=1 Tax=Monocercomonoides exilis TaxID=2049356 RepID=UPI00355A9733|nr:hypothetical protein MONOS_14951 [Monocercomonoides exilis]|eukprot:MONOS_14951.1-p1 / transcript=MONOS_14951.1 / gene=MONOS_14951 / organism=Monocercomonoides_exilis_PA203 / gene_product=unspecified product / transcript_product=unspecified product / location=Mono_scaffold01113:6177-6428(+) / protein_length=84 / sequence_SO=supercontig / SO=protein_coding / is_pseudo=false